MSQTAVVILNWNGQHYLERFLPTLLKRSYYPGVFLVIVDNGSTDGSVHWMKEKFPKIRVIELGENYGYTGGYNKSLELIEADYFILLNSDVEAAEGWLGPLITNMDNSPKVGICMPKIRSHFEKKYFEYAGASGGYMDMLGYPFCRGRILSNIEEDNKQYDYDKEIFWASGTCLMIRSSLYKELGGLDDRFFAHMEEIDLCWRAKLAGWQVWVYPESVIYHVGGGTLPNNSPKKLYLNYRNNLFMLYKNLPLYRLHITLFIRMLLDGMSAFVYMTQGKVNFVKAVFNAHIDFWKMVHKCNRDKTLSKRNVTCIYKGSIVLSFFLSLRKLRFADIEDSITKEHQ